MHVTSKRSHEGYLLLDHSNSPGITPGEISAIDSDLPFGIGRVKFEAPTYTCSHCNRVVVLNPLRQRERGYCRKCDHYVCDTCNAVRVATGVCKTIREIIDEMAAEAEKNQPQTERSPEEDIDHGEENSQP